MLADRVGSDGDDAEIRSLCAEAGWTADKGHPDARRVAGQPMKGPWVPTGAAPGHRDLPGPELWTVLVPVSRST